MERMLWLRWVGQYLSKSTSFPGYDGRGQAVVALGLVAFVIWASPAAIVFIPFFLGVRAEIDIVMVTDLRRITSKVGGALNRRQKFNDLARLVGYTSVALGTALVGFVPIYFGDQIKRRADAAGLDDIAAQSVLVLAILTAMTAILALVYRQAQRIVPATHDPRLTPNKQQRESILELAKVAEHATFAVEAAWVLIAVTIALVPTTFRASLGPNLVAGFIVPLLIAHAREDFHRFQRPHQPPRPGRRG